MAACWHEQPHRESEREREREDGTLFGQVRVAFKTQQLVKKPFCEFLAHSLTCFIKHRCGYLEKLYIDLVCKSFKKRYLIKQNDQEFFDIKGAKLPSVDGYTLRMLDGVFYETFLVACYFNDNYNKSNVLYIDRALRGDGAYGYIDGDFDVTVKAGDTVIDAGSWIGDFAAYSASKNAKCYAFEPTQEQFEILEQTAALNAPYIVPIKAGLSDNEGEAQISLCSTSSSVIKLGNAKTETIKLTTLDRFVEENHIDRVDFIKADIEGAERDMLKGAKWVLANHAPKLAICTYHLPDDPQVLEDIILDANPNYRIIHLRKKLFACVPHTR